MTGGGLCSSVEVFAMPGPMSFLSEKTDSSVNVQWKYRNVTVQPKDVAFSLPNYNYYIYIGIGTYLHTRGMCNSIWCSRKEETSFFLLPFFQVRIFFRHKVVVIIRDPPKFPFFHNCGFCKLMV